MEWFTSQHADRQFFLLAVGIYGLSMIYSVFLWRKGLRRKRSLRRALPVGTFDVGVGDGPGVSGGVGQNSCRHGDAALVVRVVAAVECKCIVGAAQDDPMAGRMTVAVGIVEIAGLQRERQELVGGTVWR